jgi:outer membrane immunogenic protein
MKTLFTAAATIAVLAALTPARAADLPLPEKMPPPSPATNWSGFYIGLEGGGVWGHTDYTGFNTIGGAPFGPSYAGSFDAKTSYLGGFQAGFNWEFATHIVIGIEADIDFSHLQASPSICSLGGCATTASDLWGFGTLRGRIGYDFNNVLIYGTGGAAWANINTNSTITTGPLAGTFAGEALALQGWTAGGGLEWLFLPNWTVKAEYLFMRFQHVDETYNYALVGPGVPFTANITTNSNINTFRIGVNYLFPVAPSAFVARY